MLTIIPETANETAQEAKQRLSEALAEAKTTFVVFRNAGGADLKNMIDTAVAIAKAQNPTEWRVVWIKDAQLVPEAHGAFFESDVTCIAVSLRWGTGEPRKIGKRYIADELSDALAIGEAFADAGPEEA